jgi:signal transduction histidine kinase
MSKRAVNMHELHARLLAQFHARAAATATWAGQQRYSWRLVLAGVLFAALMLRNGQLSIEDGAVYALCLAALFLPLVVGPRLYTTALIVCALGGWLLARQPADLLIASFVLIGMAGSQLPLLLAAIAGAAVAILFAAVQFHTAATGTLLQNLSLFAATFAGAVATHIRRVAAGRQLAMVAQLQQSHAELRLAHEQLRLDSQRTAELAAAEERERIAREIHDVLAHTLTVLVVQVGAVKRLVGRDPARAQEQLDLIAQLTRDGLAEVRRSVHALHSTDEEGVPAIAALVSSFAERTGAICTFAAASDVPALSPALSTALYRLTQEALTNAVRHGSAQHMTVSLTLEDTQLALVIEDNGIGAGAAPPVPGGGNGLPGAAERLRAFGGTLEAGPRPSGGYRVKATVPLASLTGHGERPAPGNALPAAKAPTGRVG